MKQLEGLLERSGRPFFGDRVLQFSPGPFPVPAVKFSDPRFQRVLCIQAVKIDAPAIGMRTRLVKTLYATMFAEQMFRLPAAKTVTAQITLTCYQDKVYMWHDQMQEAGPRADRAIAVEQFGRWFDIRLKADRAAMATARYLFHSRTSSV